MATQETFEREPAAAPRSMALNRLQAVGAAGGRKAATRSEQRRDKSSIEANQGQQQRCNTLIKTSPASGLVLIG